MELDGVAVVAAAEKLLKEALAFSKVEERAVARSSELSFD